MTVVELETFIRAPAEACFDAARDIDLHAGDFETPLPHRPVAGVTRGLIGPDETVTWEARFLGVKLRMTSRIVAFERPRAFADEMQRGPFRRWRHTHLFEPCGGGTLMRDRVEFASPLGPLGALVNFLYLESFVRRFLLAQNRRIKELVELESIKN
ncbi:MAG TPA: SRPBCC family protein [Pyrinomonadaceae bacterium]|nr:SRPBCC family protein [Pyrinomonadaceae bacterium]